MTNEERASRYLNGVASVLWNHPLAIAQHAIHVLLSHELNRPVADLQAFFSFYDEPADPTPDGVQIIRISGQLYRGMFYDDMADIRDRFDAAMDDINVQAIVFDVNSPGGDVSGMLELADHIYEDRGLKPILALANDQATSAAYVLASSADALYRTRTSEVGSLGVMAIHVDRSAANRKNGYAYTEVVSGRHKNDLSPNRALSSEAQQWLEDQVETIANELFETVARNRSVTVESIREQEAQVFFGADADEEGLTDGLRTLDEVVAEARESVGRVASRGSRRLAAEQEDATMAAETEKVDPKGTTTTTATVTNIDDARVEARSEGAAEATLAAQTRISEIVEACTLAGCAERAVEFINDPKMSAADVRKKLVEDRADGNGTAIDNVVETGARVKEVGEAAVPRVDMNAYYEQRRKAVRESLAQEGR